MNDELRQRARDEIRRQARAIMARRGMPEWARDIVTETAERRSVHLDELVGNCRVYTVTAARQEAIYRVKAAKPMLSAPLLGKWFDRDHTTILHSLTCHQEATGLPPFSRYNLATVKERNRQTSAAMRQPCPAI